MTGLSIRIEEVSESTHHTIVEVIINEQGQAENVSTDPPTIVIDSSFPEFHYDESVFQRLDSLPKPPDMPVDEDDDL